MGREYVLKHVRNKHAAVVEAKQEEVPLNSSCMDTVMMQLSSQEVARIFCCPGGLCTGLSCAHASSLISVGASKPCTAPRCWRRAALMQMSAAAYLEVSQEGTHG